MQITGLSDSDKINCSKCGKGLLKDLDGAKKGTNQVPFQFVCNINRLLPAQAFQVIDMGSHGQSHFRVLDIGYSKIITGFADDLADGRVVYM